MNAEVEEIKRQIAELPAERQALVYQAKNEFLAVLAKYQNEGLIALALVGAATKMAMEEMG